MVLCKKRNVSGSNRSMERVHFKKCVVSVTIRDTFGLRGNGKAGVLWCLDGATTFFLIGFHSGVVGTTFHVGLGRHLFLPSTTKCSFHVLIHLGFGDFLNVPFFC